MSSPVIVFVCNLLLPLQEGLTLFSASLSGGLESVSHMPGPVLGSQ